MSLEADYPTDLV